MFTPALRDDAVAVPARPRLAVTTLTGHSGARVTLHGSGPEAFVRKTAGDPGQSSRLASQAQKQARFAASGAPVPAVLRMGSDEGLFFFDMAHVPAISVAAQCESGAASVLKPLPALVAAWFDRLAGTIDGTIEPGRIGTKIGEILARCRGRAALHDAMPGVRLLGAALSRIDWRGLPRSDCHGDLTLENILASPDGQLTLIDFDVPDLSSLWLDAAKLYQDLDGLWCLRRLARAEGNALRLLNATLALRRLRAAIDPVIQARCPALGARLPALVALNLLRTLPYCSDRVTAAYVLERASAVLAELDPTLLG